MEKQDAETAVQKKTIFQELQNIEKDFVKEKTVLASKAAEGEKRVNALSETMAK